MWQLDCRIPKKTDNGELEKFFVGVEDAVFAGVMERDIRIGATFALIDFAGVKRFRIGVDTDSALIELWKIEDLMDRFEGINVGGVRGIHIVDVGRLEMTGAEVRIFVRDVEILDAQTSDGSRHPTILIAMIVDPARLTNLPADGHTFEDGIFEDEITCVVPF